jgi:RNA polymerase sigma-70 factor (ECF subfamily)
MPADAQPKRRFRTDEELVGEYRAGDTAAFEELVRRHHDDLMRFLVRLVGNRAVAEDAFQETFLQVHLSAETFDTSRRFKPWLFTIAANKGRDALRRSARRRTLDLSAPIGGGSGGRGADGGDGSGARSYVDLMEIDVPSPGAAMDDQERSRLVQRAVDELPWSLREILLLAYFQRLSYNQIADSLEIPLGTVKSRLHSAVAAFAKKWQALSKAESGASKTARENSSPASPDSSSREDLPPASSTETQ